MKWLHHLCRRAVVDRARHALADLPMIQPPHLDQSLSLRAFRTQHGVLVGASRRLGPEDPAAELVDNALYLIERWRRGWVSGSAEIQIDTYRDLRSGLHRIEHDLAFLMGWHPLTPVAVS